jgi:hypothetical protein
MMSKYVIERRLPGIGKETRDHLAQAAAKSNEVLRNLGVGVQWVQSYVTDDAIYCVYVAENEDLIRRHAQLSGFPADRIVRVQALLDPASEATA